MSFTFATAAASSSSSSRPSAGFRTRHGAPCTTWCPPERRAQVLAFQDGVPGQVGTALSGILLLTAARFLAPDQVFWLGPRDRRGPDRSRARDPTPIRGQPAPEPARGRRRTAARRRSRAWAISSRPRTSEPRYRGPGAPERSDPGDGGVTAGPLVGAGCADRAGWGASATTTRAFVVRQRARCWRSRQAAPRWRPKETPLARVPEWSWTTCSGAGLPNAWPARRLLAAGRALPGMPSKPTWEIASRACGRPPWRPSANRTTPRRPPCSVRGLDDPAALVRHGCGRCPVDAGDGSLGGHRRARGLLAGRSGGVAPGHGWPWSRGRAGGALLGGEHDRPGDCLSPTPSTRSARGNR